MTRGAGFLAIWSEIVPSEELDYLHWLTREHTAERVGVPGFHGVRVFRALRDDISRYFILYELTAAEVVDSPAYLARLNAPTPWTREIMPKLGGFLRGGGRLDRAAGLGSGGTAAVCRLAADEVAVAGRHVASLAALDGICAVSTLLVDQRRSTVPTQEKGTRAGDDGIFGGLLIIEALHRTAAQAALAASGLGGELYAQVFSLAEGAREAAGGEFTP